MSLKIFPNMLIETTETENPLLERGLYDEQPTPEEDFRSLEHYH
jgi:hypothetical protein